MRKFGLELRKAGTVQNLYSDVDSVLKKAGIKPASGEINTSVQTQHCVHWSDMTDEYWMTLTAMILDDFRSVLNPET